MVSKRKGRKLSISFSIMSTNNRSLPLAVLFGSMVSLQLVFLTEVYLDLSLAGIFEAYRGGWLLAQFVGTLVLFVDMVIRYDEINPRHRPWHVIGVAFCAMGWCFQFFVHYLDSALMS